MREMNRMATVSQRLGCRLASDSKVAFHPGVVNTRPRIQDIVVADIRELDLKLLQAFVTLIDEESVSRAAERLSVAQSSLSGMLKRLRELFGDPLFVRTSHGVRPTPRAHELGRDIREVLERIEALLIPEDFAPAQATLTIAISATDYSQLAIVNPLIAHLRPLSPQSRVSVMPFEIAALNERLASGHIDLALTVPAFAPDDLPSRQLYHESYVCAVGRQHPLAAAIAAGDIDVADICRFSHGIVSPVGGSFRGPVDDALEQLGHRRQVAASMPNSVALLHLLQVSDLIAFLPARLLPHYRDCMTWCEPPFAVDGFSMIAVWHRRTHLDPGHRWLRQQLYQTVNTVNTVNQQ